MKCGVVVFPGSNCDHDVYHVLRQVLRQPTEWLWHENETTAECDLVVVPGGFSYGDYLRAGSMGALSPVMAAVRRHADAGGLVFGICNGFQILLEAGLLPGAMRRNRGLRFISRDVFVRVERVDLPFTAGCEPGQILRLPIAHAEGNYADLPTALDLLERQRQVVFRYVGPNGEDGDEHNPNGSEREIAGICNPAGNVCALMPHPERAAEQVLGNDDGLALLSGLLSTAGAGLRASSSP